MFPPHPAIELREHFRWELPRKLTVKNSDLQTVSHRREKEERRNHVARRPDQRTQPKYIFDADITVLFYSDSCSAISPNYASEHSR